ncbi:SDR family NAD(P)-dependent oxidoreductase [Cryptosporangium aurantiacum]|uniref:3-oxoacyl-[acyl-carrier protein] reductase n=1 Tax=Cryptosporangium aurantiacum TaxID=134849 RepID=A0A1M7RQ50_9ACTN|nr:SDR family NAD(P)-dependent oxidoreductase [Cryptosporangium aurantiacum]SHN48178.1 3-oxoacyl-[acyl-carrier protein] reductase [Cryptosporangium aurantiacum]
MSDRFDLSGRVAVVTGAGSGLGAGTAVRLAAAGAHVACVDVSGANADDTAKRIADAGGAAGAYAVDVRHKPDVDALLDEVAATHGRVDVVANFAGIIRTGPVVDITVSDLDAVFDVNLKGTLFACQAAARHMVPRGSGSIINVASAAVDFAARNNGVYSMSKVAVAQLSRTLASELGGAGIRVNVLAPGFVATAMTNRHFTAPDGSPDEQRRDAVLAGHRKSTPLGSICEPEDVADAALYLASDAARFVTGQILRINGGVAMPL